MSSLLSPGSCLHFFIAHTVHNPTARRFFIECYLLTLSRFPASQVVRKKKSPRNYTHMHSRGFELTKLTYTRLKDHLIRHLGDRQYMIHGAAPGYRGLSNAHKRSSVPVVKGSTRINHTGVSLTCRHAPRSNTYVQYLVFKVRPYLCYHHDCFRGAAFHTAEGSIYQVTPRLIIRNPITYGTQNIHRPVSSNRIPKTTPTTTCVSVWLPPPPSSTPPPPPPSFCRHS